MIIAGVIVLSTASCGLYSFTGAALDPQVKTITIDYFYNDAASGPTNLSQLLTEKLKDYFQQNTSLSLVEENGDLQLDGNINQYDFTPVAPQSSGSEQVGDVAGLMRLTITVNASYVNAYNDEFDFNNRSFSFFSDFSADRDPSTVEEQLVDEILDQIVFDIFTATVANW